MLPQNFRGHFEISIMKKLSNIKFDFSNLNALRSKKVDIPQKVILKMDSCARKWFKRLRWVEIGFLGKVHEKECKIDIPSLYDCLRLPVT